MEQLMAYNQGGTVKDYCDSFQILCDQVRKVEEISEFYAIYLFICGFEPKIRKIFVKWHQYSCTKVKDAISLALKIDSNGLKDSFSPFDPNSSFYNKDLEFDINITLEELMKDNEFFMNGKIQEDDIIQETIDDEIFEEPTVHQSRFVFKLIDSNDSMRKERVIDNDVLRENQKDNKNAPKVFDEMLGRLVIHETIGESDKGNDIQAKESFDSGLLFEKVSKYVVTSRISSRHVKNQKVTPLNEDSSHLIWDPRCRFQEEDSEEYGSPIVSSSAIADTIKSRTDAMLKKTKTAVSSKPMVMKAEYAHCPNLTIIDTSEFVLKATEGEPESTPEEILSMVISLEIVIYDTAKGKFDVSRSHYAHVQAVTGLACLYSCGQDNSLHSWIIKGDSLYEVPLPPNNLGVKMYTDVPNVFDACFGIAVFPANLVQAFVFDTCD